MALKIFLAAIVALLIGGIAFGFYRAMPPATTQTMAPASIKSITIGTTTIAVEVADTEAAREQGLSDRANLPPNSGMLFVFDAPSTVGFWMKDMEFSLDMLFIDQNGTIVTIDQNLSPSSYHAQNPQSSQVFYPRLPVSYVLEVPAGFVAAHGIAEGMRVSFQ